MLHSVSLHFYKVLFFNKLSENLVTPVPFCYTRACNKHWPLGNSHYFCSAISPCQVRWFRWVQVGSGGPGGLRWSRWSRWSRPAQVVQASLSDQFLLQRNNRYLGPYPQPARKGQEAKAPVYIQVAVLFVNQTGPI